MSFLLFQHREGAGQRLSLARRRAKAVRFESDDDLPGADQLNVSRGSKLTGVLDAPERLASGLCETPVHDAVFEERRDTSSARRVNVPHSGDVHLFVEEVAGDGTGVSPAAVVRIQRGSPHSRALASVSELERRLASPTKLPHPTSAVPFKLTIVVPVYNEEHTIGRVLEALVAQSIPGDFEIIVVDDGSTDRTREMLQASWHSRHVHIRHETNRGKGAAVRTGIARASGTHLLVFDADSEYDPADIPRLIAPILSGRAEVVYGVRVRGAGVVFPSFINLLGNRVMTAAANLLYGSAMSDLHTCLKLLPLPLLRLMPLKEEGFGLDTEVSAELLRRGFRPFEVPVSYVGRSREEGKKIRLSDAFRCFEVLVRVRLRGRTRYGIRDKSLLPSVSESMLSETTVLSEVANAMDM
ncbi:MAG: glycosyltransferase family 2 protein [Acidimicrobiales bacterium]|jgi:hypothetical protein